MQLGRALNRVLHRIATADPADSPVYLMKLDLSDGFYRVPLRDSDIPLLGVAFPVAPGETPLVAMPLVLPMGWTESPPYFCSATETIADLANNLAHSTWSPPPHPLEVAAATAPEADTALTLTAPAPPPFQHALHRPVSVPTAHRSRRRRRPLRYADVFVDDEILVAQGDPASLNAFHRKLLHLNDRVFHPNDEADDLSIRREPISLKKLDKGDACWATRKIVLGWLIDTLKGTIELPPHRHHRLNHILSVTLASRRVSTKAWHKLLGELRTMVLGIPGGHGLFSQLQLVLRSRKHHRIRIHKEVRDQLLDLQLLADDLAARPTRIAEVVPAAPHYVGCSDAALSGMGGVWFPPSGGHIHPPYVWREAFPPHIQASLISEQNPRGTITNSDQELVATIGHVATLAQTHDLRELTVATFSDNTPAVAWGTKGSVTTAGPASYLLRTASLDQRAHRYISQRFYIPGPANALADLASRRFDLSDADLLATLNSRAPHSQPWQMLHLQPDMRLQLTTDLQRQRLTWPSLASVPAPKIAFGPTIGSRSRKPWAWIRFCRPWTTRSGSATAAPAVAVTRSTLNAYATRSWPSRRSSPQWASRIPGSRLLATWTRA